MDGVGLLLIGFIVAIGIFLLGVAIDAAILWLVWNYIINFIFNFSEMSYQLAFLICFVVKFILK